MGGGAWWAEVHGVAKSRTRLSDFTFTFHFHALEKETAPHSSVLAWRTPGTGEPGGLPSVELHRVGHDWSDLAAAAGCWTHKWKEVIWAEREACNSSYLSTSRIKKKKKKYFKPVNLIVKIMPISEKRFLSKKQFKYPEQKKVNVKFYWLL